MYLGVFGMVSSFLGLSFALRIFFSLMLLCGVSLLLMLDVLWSLCNWAFNW